MNLKQALAANKGIGPGFHFLRHALSVIILIHHLRIMIIGDRANAEGSTFAGKIGAAATSPAGEAATAAATYAKGDITTVTSYGAFAIELLRPGLFALVGMFFALSGFLVMGSALRSKSVKVFFLNRALRIIPALSVEVTLAALVIGPLVTVLPIGEYFSDPELYRYFGNIVGHVSYFLPGVFVDNPWPRIVNGNLWTLPEFYCYLIMLVVLATGLLSHHRKLTAATILVVVVAYGLQFYDDAFFTIRADQTHFTSWYIVLLFCMGAVAYVNAEKIPLHMGLFAVSGILYYISIMANIAAPISGVFLTYCMIYIGFCRFPLFDRLLKDDLSYGIYLYGWPLSQTLVWLLLPSMVGMGTYTKFAILAPITLVVVSVFAKLSWHLIEKPALASRRHFIKPNKAVTVAVGGEPR